MLPTLAISRSPISVKLCKGFTREKSETKTGVGIQACTVENLVRDPLRVHDGKKDEDNFKRKWLVSVEHA
jgi:hypothetical protein